MFDSLKKKLSGWFGKKEEEEPEKKPKKEKKKESEKKVKKTEKKKEVKKESKTEKSKEVKDKKLEKKTEKKVKEEKKDIEIPPDSVTLQSGISNRHSRTKDNALNGKVYKKKEEEEIKEKDEKISEEIEEEKEDEKEDSEELEEKEEKNGESEEEIKEEAKEVLGEKKEGGWLAKWWMKKDDQKEELEKELEEKSEEEEDEKEQEKEKVEIEAKEEIEIKEVQKETEEEGFFAKLKKKLSSGGELTQEEFEEYFTDLEITLLENNVALEVVDKVKESLSKSLVGASVKKSESEKKIIESLKEAILEVLIEGEDVLKKIKESKEMPYVILFFGINGSGKTTSVAKMAYKLKKEGISCVMAAGDTFRAASIEQLEKHAIKIGVPIIKSGYESDPASVGFEAISYAKKNKIKVVLIDTAGRMYTKSNLMKEMEKIVKVTKPDLKIFVGESITGNDAVTQCKMFNETVGIDGIILTKSDVDEKGGAILSVSYISKKPIFYLGVGQGLSDLELFKKEDVLKGLGLEN